MLLCSDAPTAIVPVPVDPVCEDPVRSAARMIMSRVASLKRHIPERRSDYRQAFPYPFRLTPLNHDQPLIGATFAVMGKHITERGIDFYHTEPISDRRIIATFECNGSSESLILELTWCRFGQHGWYENGGRFLKNVESPFDVNDASVATSG